MRSVTRAFLTVTTIGLFATLGVAAPAKKEPAIPGGSSGSGKAKPLSLVRGNVTGQTYDYSRPWQKKASFSKRGLGSVLPQGKVLVTAHVVTNQNYVELERAESGDKGAADVAVIDSESNL